MEDTLRAYDDDEWRNVDAVLILVLMEDTLRERSQVSLREIVVVLILVLMEDTLRVLQRCESLR